MLIGWEITSVIITYTSLSHCHNGPGTAGAIVCRNRIFSMKVLQFLYSTRTSLSRLEYLKKIQSWPWYNPFHERHSLTRTRFPTTICACCLLFHYRLKSSTKVQNPRRCSRKDKHLKRFYIRWMKRSITRTTITHCRAQIKYLGAIVGNGRHRN